MVSALLSEAGERGIAPVRRCRQPRRITPPVAGEEISHGSRHGTGHLVLVGKAGQKGVGAGNNLVDRIFNIPAERVAEIRLLQKNILRIELRSQ